jgi:glucose-1-phosphate adenylyltransferase
MLPAQQRVHGENWYRGTADAVTQNLDIIRRYSAEYIVILAGDHIYKQDYSRMLDRPRRKRGALHRGVSACARC